MAQGMVFPQTNRPQDVNVSLIRIANMNNKDIDMMQQEVTRIKNQQDELKKSFDIQVKRWQNYRESYDATTKMFSLLNGTLTYDEIVKTFPGYAGD
jgi:hypothetical protein